MGMQIHFQVEDIPDYLVVREHSNQNNIGSDEHPEYYTDHYIVVDPGSYYFNTCEKHLNAWTDIGSGSERQMQIIEWLIRNRIPFNAS